MTQMCNPCLRTDGTHVPGLYMRGSGSWWKGYDLRRVTLVDQVSDIFCHCASPFSD